MLRLTLSTALGTMLLVVPGSAIAKQNVPQPVRDPIAVQLVTSMIVAGGWNSMPPSTVIATGTTTSQGHTETLIVKAKPGWIRIERPDSQIIVIVGGCLGTVSTNGTIQPLMGSEAASILPLMFPFYAELVSVNDPTLSVTSGGDDVVLGIPVHIINLASTAYVGDGQDPLRQAASQISIAIAIDTFMPLRIQFQRMARETEHAGVDVMAYLSDFRNVNGMLVPYRYEEDAGNQTLLVFQFQSVLFDQPIPDSDFNLY